MFYHFTAASLRQRFSVSSEQNIAVDKRYQTKVEVIVRNITPKAGFQHPNFREPKISLLANILVQRPGA
jgi:hypothetical protein